VILLQEAGILFGGSVNAFSRYETGKTKPPLALVKLFQLLDSHPDLLGEIRQATHYSGSASNTISS
jgi:HTH-type transcriptional regulator / antitoxin MqsA